MTVSRTVMVLASVVLACVVSGESSPVGGMSQGRAFAGAVGLRDGRILVVGGSHQTNASALASAEVFDATSARFIQTGPMSVPRVHDTVTMLNDGNVLVVGGTGETQRVQHASAEIFSPSSGTFRLTFGSMNLKRRGHTATLLRDGTVLVAGGAIWPGSNDVPVSRAEVFDPATETFRPVGNMRTPRFLAQAVLLPEGRVLIVGGQGVGPFVDTAEVYDPTTGEFSFVDSPRQLHLGGCAVLTRTLEVLFVGGRGSPNPVVEVYNPSTGKWRDGAVLLEDLSGGHTCSTLPTGETLVAGGGLQSQTLAILSSDGSTMRQQGTMTIGRRYHTASLLSDGRVLLAGGNYGPDTWSAAEIYAGVPEALLTRVVPVIGTARGAAGSNFKTNLQFHNPHGTAITYQAVFRAQRRPGTEADPTKNFTLAAGASVAYTDLVGELGGEGFGSLDIVSAVNMAPEVLAQVYNDSGSDGTTGFLLQGMPPQRALATGQSVVFFTPPDVRFRQNFGMRCLESGAEFSVTTRSATGVQRGWRAASCPATYFEQVDANTFAGLTLLPGDTLLLQVTRGRMFVYSAVIDNTTNDPAIVVADP